MWNAFLACVLMLLKMTPDIIVYSVIFSFFGYVIDTHDRNSGLWYSDALSTLGIVAGAVFAVWINL
jgi:hypothetical protein